MAYILTATTKALKPEKKTRLQKKIITHTVLDSIMQSIYQKKSIIKNNKIMYIVCVDGYAKVVIIVVINHKKKIGCVCKFRYKYSFRCW